MLRTAFGFSAAHIKYGVIDSMHVSSNQHTMSQWGYREHNSIELDVYTGCCHYPAQNDLASFWSANHKALVEIVKAVRNYGYQLIKYTVTTVNFCQRLSI